MTPRAVALLLAVACGPRPGDTPTDTTDAPQATDASGPLYTPEPVVEDTGPLPIVRGALTSGATWRAVGFDLGGSPPEGWADPGFDDADWPEARPYNDGSCGASAWAPEGSAYPAGEPMWSSDERYGAAMRRTLEISGLDRVTDARITVFADDDVAVWLDGVEIYREVDFGIPEDERFDNQVIPHEIDLLPHLREGRQVLGLLAVDSAGGGCRWAMVSGGLTFRLSR
jgi:hypothetical protein